MHKIKLSTQNEPLEADYSDFTSIKLPLSANYPDIPFFLNNRDLEII